jgi:hypothetical protein
MAQQSNTEPRGTEKTTGARTREQQKAVIGRRERTDGTEVDPQQKSLPKRVRTPSSQPANSRFPMAIAQSSAAPIRKANTTSAGSIKRERQIDGAAILP